MKLTLWPGLEVPKLIGLTGIKESGKDTVSALLSLLGYKRYAFADGVKDEVETHLIERNYGGNVLPDDMLTPPQEVYSAFRFCSRHEVWEKPTTPKMRKLLQYWGTEYRRGQNPDYWVEKLMSEAKTETTPVVITDVSFQNEADFIHKWDGVLWRVNRQNTPNSDLHASEIGRATIPVDYELDNSKDILHLAQQIKGALKWCRQQ